MAENRRIAPGLGPSYCGGSCGTTADCKVGCECNNVWQCVPRRGDRDPCPDGDWQQCPCPNDSSVWCSGTTSEWHTCEYKCNNSVYNYWDDTCTCGGGIKPKLKREKMPARPSQQYKRGGKANTNSRFSGRTQNNPKGRHKK